MEVPITIAATLTYYATVIITFRLCRFIAEKNLSPKLKRISFEVFATMQTCMCTFENSIVYGAFGLQVYSVGLFVLSFINQIEFGIGKGNPCGILVDFFAGSEDVTTTGALLGVQAVVARIAFPCTQLLRSLLPCQVHQVRSQLWSCISDLKVSILWGVWYEFLATFFYGLFCCMVKRQWKKFGIPLSAVASAITTLAGIFTFLCLYITISIFVTYFGMTIYILLQGIKFI